MIKRGIIAAAVILLLSSGVAFAHPGKTDANGGHTCRTKCAKWGLKDGQYHKHGLKTKVAKTTAKTAGKVASKGDTKKSAATKQPSASGSCSADTYNCTDFSTCSRVRIIFNACPSDNNKLDGDNDGIPCESLCD